jgi:16S rRNA (guanine527-N7)-methyltransferase
MHSQACKHWAKEKFDVTISEEMIAQLSLYQRLLQHENQRVNLTAISTTEMIWEKHFLDSLAIGTLFHKTSVPDSLIDIGTGAGFPGIVLKIVFPHIKVALVESIHKKAQFCEMVCSQLQLRDISVHVNRAEEVANLQENNGSWDIAVSRAVASSVIAIPLLMSFIKPSGHICLYKGEKVLQELAVVSETYPQLRSKIVPIPYRLPSDTRDRSLVVCPKYPLAC